MTDERGQSDLKFESEGGRNTTLADVLQLNHQFASGLYDCPANEWLHFPYAEADNQREAGGVNMSIFSFFKSKAAVDPEAEASAAVEIRSRRDHPRYAMTPVDGIFFEDSAGQKFNVIDISFKGSLISPRSESSTEPSIAEQSISLSLFGHKLNLPLRESQKRKKGWALVFDHRSDQVVVNLSKMIEPIRLGATCRRIPKEFSKDVVDAVRSRYSGDGPLDLVVDRDQQNKLQFAMVTVRRGVNYCSLLYENKTVITKKTVDSTGIGARMAQTAEVDLDLVVFVATACAAMPFPDGSAVASEIGQWLNRPI